MGAEATYEADPGTTPISPPDAETLWRLRARGCWDVAADLLAPYAAGDPAASLTRAELLIERCMFTALGWDAAETALRQAEAAARDDRQRAAAACERGYLAYAATRLGVHDRLDEAQAALGRASALLAPEDPRRALLHFRRGLVAETLLGDRSAARAAYLRAHAGAEQLQDDLLRSYTWQRIAALAQEDGNLAGARHGYVESLRLRERLGFAVGTAPALASLAGVSPAPEAAALRAQARRLLDAFGGVPVGLAKELDGAG